jgi:hypothetical protein
MGETPGQRNRARGLLHGGETRPSYEEISEGFRQLDAANPEVAAEYRALRQLLEGSGRPVSNLSGITGHSDGSMSATIFYWTDAGRFKIELEYRP